MSYDNKREVNQKKKQNPFSFAIDYNSNSNSNSNSNNTSHNQHDLFILFENLKETLIKIINKNRLQLPQMVVRMQLKKIESMQMRIGISSKNFTINDYNLHYERVVLNPNNFYANQLSLLRLNVEYNHETLDRINTIQQPDAVGAFIREDLSTDSAIISASMANNNNPLTRWMLGGGSLSSPFYIKSRNLIVVPYGFLQMPVYHQNLSDLYKYSIFGFNLAHEMMHGFDASGIDYDSGGNLMGPSEEIAANQRFIQGLRCMQNELAIGSRNLNEKLADYEGIRLVFTAYFNNNQLIVTNNYRNGSTPYNQDVVDDGIAADNQTNAARPSTHLQPQQLFFVNFAQFFCGKVHPKLRQTAYLEHAMDELRVLQTLANFEEFSKAFQCERRDKMQSRHRCHLW